MIVYETVAQIDYYRCSDSQDTAVPAGSLSLIFTYCQTYEEHNLPACHRQYAVMERLHAWI